MILYLGLLLIVYILGQAKIIDQVGSGASLNSNRFDALWRTILIFLVIVVGFRHGVGGDWDNYWKRFAAGPIFSEDPAYYGLFTWFVYILDLPIYFLNLLCAAVSIWCLSIWYKSSNFHWIILLASIPYLIAVVQMGYTRQGVAISIISLAYYLLLNGRFKLFLLAVLAASLFHSSAILFFLLPILAFSWKKLLLGAAGFTGFFSIVLFLSGGALDFTFLEVISPKLTVYIEVEQSSSGALLRGIMGLIFSIVAAIFAPARAGFKTIEFKMIIACCLVFLIVVLLSIFTSFNTIFDRLALYFIPIYLFYFTHNLLTFFNTDADQILLTSILFCLNIIILTVVMNFGSNMYFYRDYNFWPFFVLFGNTECVAPTSGRCDKGHF